MLTGQTTNVNDCGTTPNRRLLTQSHRADLKKSGLSNDTILQSGCYSASEDETRDILGFYVGPGLVFPYPGVLTSDGRPFCSVKPDQPPIINGKPAEYLVRKRKRHSAWGITTTRPRLRKGSS